MKPPREINLKKNFAEIPMPVMKLKMKFLKTSVTFTKNRGDCVFEECLHILLKRTCVSPMNFSSTHFRYN